MLALVALGCTSNGTNGTDGSTRTADCSGQVRVEGSVYTSYGYTERSATRHSAADAAECHDVGEAAAGSVFPDHPRQVTIWAFPGYSPEQVLGVRFDRDSFEVFVADSVASPVRDRLLRELGHGRVADPGRRETAARRSGRR